MAGAHMGNVTMLQGWGQHQGRGPGLEAAVGSEPCLSYPSNRSPTPLGSVRLPASACRSLCDP